MLNVCPSVTYVFAKFISVQPPPRFLRAMAPQGVVAVDVVSGSFIHKVDSSVWTPACSLDQEEAGCNDKPLGIAKEQKNGDHYELSARTGHGPNDGNSMSGQFLCQGFTYGVLPVLIRVDFALVQAYLIPILLFLGLSV